MRLSDLGDRDVETEVERAGLHRLRSMITAFVRERGPKVLLTETGVWVLSEMTDDEKVAFAFEVHPKLKRKLPAATWRGLGKLSTP